MQSKICLWTETDLLNFKITLSLAKLEIVGSRLKWNGLIFSDDIPADILLTLLLLSNITELSVGVKTKKFW